MKNYEVPKAIEPWRIICAMQTEPDYDEERFMLIYAGDNVYDDRYALIEGSHCSCYDWNDTEFHGTEYTRKELETLYKNKDENAFWYNAERRLWKLIEEALGFKGMSF